MRLGGLLVLLLVAACMPKPYEEPRPPRVDPGTEDGETVVGHVSPEGTLVADTLARSLPDTSRVERETVVTGEIRAAGDLADAGPASDSRDGPPLATGWRVQVYASHDAAEAASMGTRVRNAIGDAAPVYVERDEDWYKVRVGDCSDRAEAERLRERLAGRGWTEAWVVRTTIRTSP